MGRSDFAAVFIDETLRTEAKSGRWALGKRFEMSLERPGRQSVIRIEKNQEVSGTPLEAEVSGCRAAAIFRSYNADVAGLRKNGSDRYGRAVVNDNDLNVWVRLLLNAPHSLRNKAFLLIIRNNHGYQWAGWLGGASRKSV
jgi:hypothetical protein